MNTAHQPTLIDNFNYLKANLMVSGSGLLDRLRVALVLNEEEVESITAQRCESERVERLLNIIMRTSEQQYEMFLCCLVDADQKFISDTLRGKNSK